MFRIIKKYVAFMARLQSTCKNFVTLWFKGKKSSAVHLKERGISPIPARVFPTKNAYFRKIKKKKV